MLIEVLKSKIHRVKVTEAELHYLGSITLDTELMKASRIVENEKVQIVNINNGERFDTYVIAGERGTGQVCINGPAARKVQVGDIIIVMSFAAMDPSEAEQFKPILIFPDENNRIR